MLINWNLLFIMQFHIKIAISAFFRKIKEVSYLAILNKEHMMLVRD